LRFLRHLSAHAYERKPDHIHLAGSFPGKEICDAKLPAFSLPRKRTSQRFPLWTSVPSVVSLVLLWLIHHHIIPVTLARKISPNHLRLENSASNYFFFQLLLDWPKLLLHQPQII